MIADGINSQVNIFVASSGELAEEREETRLIVQGVNKLFLHLKLDVIQWEADLPSGSYQKDCIQDEINPLLEKSQIVMVIFYSKLGKFTLEEYHLAIEKRKKVFLYFKKGFSPTNPQENKVYHQVLEFRERIIEENQTLFKDYETIDQFKYNIHKDLCLYLNENYPAPMPASSKFLTAPPTKNVELLGREAELEGMAHQLEQSRLVLLVNGLGGVGKTELCKCFFWDHVNDYDYLAWVDVVGSIRDSFVNAFKVEAVGCCAEDTVDERFEKIAAKLEGLDARCLLVVDNIENENDADLERLRALPVKVIANSRLNIAGFRTHTLDFLSPDQCKRLFYNYYSGKRDVDADSYVEKIVERCGRHTLSVELLAKTAENAAMPVKDFHEILKQKGFNLNDVIGDEVHTFWHNEKKRKRFFDHLLTIFDLSGVTEEERGILANLSVLPSVFIPMADVRDWLGLENNTVVNLLVTKGWLRKEEKGFGIFMHQVIQEVVRYMTAPNAALCANLIDTLTGCLSLKPAENPIDKKKYIVFAETLLGHLVEKEQSLATLANNLALRLRELGSLKNALEFQLKASAIYKKVLDKNHPYLAASYNNLALIYQDLGQPETAKKFQLKALSIRKQVLDKNHPELANSYNNLSVIYVALGQPGKALKFQLKALIIREQVLDKNHPDLATTYNNLSVIYKALMKPEKALEFQLKALDIMEQGLDRNHPRLATSYNNLALIYNDLEDYESAVANGEKAVAIMQHLFPDGHPNLDVMKRNLEEIRKRWKGKR